ncbi:bifunctional UDP-N-acetylmuramoyl-tripeptide:D-alanyl-D-alanine ligase/alanine racemase [Riemerella columbina]|uniref:bifunctional UDP-N-acetylmuramoyl-tripeptide:D-alanyl-D-alanine ligase/alanine racemase n=1 Tax=Riemerella columbina TaxID=103810 RepID=UPI00267027DE|nr:bifunctional UDP-N-acetylmuramoyl-tripeptide:D-alanyl-D-alanine ligase/alanine racemase [Riemerella columbina]WKS95318.1 bifunctional UDP-N-acetylmuramoyl-tripeptide:D-alanyl-D-alanine ligase/alanine racemase [Riemerella columbina]
MDYTIKQLSEIFGVPYFGSPDARVKHLAFDTRTIYSTQDTAFIAIKTQKNNGEKYIREAIEKGIKIIISEHKIADIAGVSWLIVPHSLAFLQNLAQYHLRQHSLKTIGITGSNGKTIVKEWLYQCLSETYNAVKSPKSFNSQLGLPLSLLKIDATHELGIFEVGISQPKEMAVLASIFPPQIGVLTHIGTAHIAHFKDLEALILEKIALFESSEVIIFNGDNPLVKNKILALYSTKTLISYGLQPHHEVYIASDWKNRNLPIVVQCLDTIITFEAQQRDEATLTNVLAVISVLHYLGFSNAEIIEKINVLKAVEMRLEQVNGIRNNLIINDSFNLDLDSLKIAFEFIKTHNKPLKSLVITDFAEANHTPSLYQEVARLTNEQGFNRVFLIGAEITQYQNLFSAESFCFNNIEELFKNQTFNQLENQLVLLKGARKFEIEKVKTYLELQKHDTVLEVNLSKILHNINCHKALLKPETKMMAMVKAHSYGLGGYEIAEFLQHHHLDYLGVAVADEGAELRKHGITLPIIVMNPEQHSYNAIIDFKLEPNIYSFRVLELFYEQLKQRGYQGHYPIHIKLETGMHRLGFKPFELPDLIQRLKQMKLQVVSIFSHLSSSDLPTEKDYTESQCLSFQAMANTLIAGLGYTPILHILNSAGITNYPEYQMDMVRIGIGMIGISSNPKIKALLQPAVAFKSVISQISEIVPQDSVSYGRRYKAEHKTRIATIPVGYADGVPRLVGNQVGQVNIKGQLCPIIGSVCMDMMMVELGDLPAKEGDEVVIFHENPSIETFAEYCQTIPYEVLTSISRRVKRIYIKD